MATVFGRIQNFIQNLTPSECKITEYLERSPEEVVGGSIHEVARKAGVSVASVSRLAVRLGFKDWKELRLNLVKDLDKKPPIVFSDIERDDPGETMIKKIFECSMISLGDTFDQINKQSILKVVAAIKKADRLVFFGTGRSGCFAMEEALRFAHLNLYAEAYDDEYQATLQSTRMREGQIAFGFSNSGRSKVTVAALAEAKRRRAMTVGIANYRGTPLEKYSDIYFCTSFPRIGEISTSLTARIALLCIMDSIFVLASRDRELAQGIESMDRMVDKKLRVPAKGRAKRS